MKLPFFTAFGSRNYRLYFYGQSISLIGTWMQRTAVGWVVYRRPKPVYAGAVAFLYAVPVFCLSTAGGVISDRYNRYRVLLFTQVASLVQSLLLAALIYSNHYAVWEILALGVLLGVSMLLMSRRGNPWSTRWWMTKPTCPMRWL